MTIGFYLEIVAILLIWQALIFAVLFGGIYQKTRHYPKKFISWYMAANAAYFFIVWVNFFDYRGILRYVYPFSMPLLLTFLPLFYFYFRSLTTVKYRVKGKQWFHLAPSAIALLLQSLYFFLPIADQIDFVARRPVSVSYYWLYEYLMWLNRISFYGVFTIQFLFYVMKFRTNLKLHRLRIELMFSYKESIDLSWMNYLFAGILLFFIGNDLSYFLKDSHPWYSVSFYCIGMLLINFFIGYHSLIQNQYVENEIISRMTHYCALHREMTKPHSENQELFIAEQLQKYQRSALKDDTRGQIIKQLDSLMEDEELYNDSQISIEELAMKLGISSKHLSQAINEVHQKNFFNYINEWRINKAKGMLQGSEHRNLSIEGIAKVVGFQSKSSFYTAFKKATGITPTEFRENADNVIMNQIAD